MKEKGVQVFKLPMDARLEIEVIAACKRG